MSLTSKAWAAAATVASVATPKSPQLPPATIEVVFGASDAAASATVDHAATLLASLTGPSLAASGHRRVGVVRLAVGAELGVPTVMSATPGVACWYLNPMTTLRSREAVNATHVCNTAAQRLADEGSDATAGAFAVMPCDTAGGSTASLGSGPSNSNSACAAVAYASASGLLYSVHSVAAALLRGEDAIAPEVAVPKLEYRALKLNLPWSPYRQGPSTDVNYATARDPAFYEALLGTLVASRINVLSLWAVHPWPFMVRAAGWPLATPFNETELEEWRSLWTGVFAMAKARGIDTYIVDWNIYASAEFKSAYDSNVTSDKELNGPGSLDPVVAAYTRQSIAQTLAAYPNLTGIGVSLGDAMRNLDLATQVDWVEKVVFPALEDAAVNRTNAPKLIYRAAFAEGKDHNNDPAVCRASVEAFVKKTGIKTVVQEKFNWSHGHSTTTLVHVHGGGTGAEYFGSAYYNVTWMIRNEDFFFLRWARPAFVRAHIEKNGGAVAGYAIGSEGYIPAKEYAHQPDSPHVQWRYSFEKQWLWYLVWGRLLFDESTPDSEFADAIAQRYGLAGPAGAALAASLMDAWQQVGVVSLAIASFVYNTWDFTLHAEAFIQCAGNADHASNGSCFISLTTLLESNTLDPGLQSVASFVSRPNASQTSPLELADTVGGNASAAAAWLESELPLNGSSLSKLLPELQCEVHDLHTWAALGLYFAAKLQAAVEFARFRANPSAKDHQRNAVALLQQAQAHWERLVDVTGAHLLPEIPLHDNNNRNFSWASLKAHVADDIALAQRG